MKIKYIFYESSQLIYTQITEIKTNIYYKYVLQVILILYIYYCIFMTLKQYISNQLILYNIINYLFILV